MRPGELRWAEWAGFDLDGATCAIPGRRMKTGTDHIVPLSTQAVAILRAPQPLTGNRHLVFPSLRSRGRPINENTLTAALRRLGYAKDTMTAHGFRAIGPDDARRGARRAGRADRAPAGPRLNGDPSHVPRTAPGGGLEYQ